MPQTALNRTATLMIRIRTASGERRYVKPVYAANRRLKPLHAMVDGKPVQHPEGVYALRFKNAQGKYTWEHVGSDAEAAQTAKLRRDSLLRSGALGLAVPETTPVAVMAPKTRAATGVLLKDKVDAYHVYIEARLRHRTITAYHAATTALLAACNKRLLADVTNQDIDEMIAYLKRKGNSPRTRANRVTALRTFLRWAERPELVTKKDIPTFTEKVVAAYSPHQVRNLITAADAERRLLWEFFVGSGCREQEVIYATWPDLNFETGVLHITEKADFKFTIKDGEEREIPLPDDLLRNLQARRQRRPKDRLIFPTVRGKPEGHFLRILKGTARKAGLNCGHCVNKAGRSCSTHPVCKVWELHRFRKTFATLHHESGVSPRTLMRWLGHSDFATTLRYLEAADVRSDKTRKLVNRTFSNLGLGI